MTLFGGAFVPLNTVRCREVRVIEQNAWASKFVLCFCIALFGLSFCPGHRN
jgi:hypothetical protein